MDAKFECRNFGLEPCAAFKLARSTKAEDNIMMAVYLRTKTMIAIRWDGGPKQVREQLLQSEICIACTARCWIVHVIWTFPEHRSGFRHVGQIEFISFHYHLAVCIRFTYLLFNNNCVWEPAKHEVHEWWQNRFFSDSSEKWRSQLQANSDPKT